MVKVFVYGTLKRGFPNNKFLTEPKNGLAEFLCSATTKDRYPLIDGTEYHLPFLLNKPGTGHHILGDVYEVDTQMKELLDRVERVGVVYDALDLVVQNLKDGKEMDCVSYVLNNFHENLLEKQMMEDYTSGTAELYVPMSKRSLKVEDWVLQVKKVT